MRSGSSTGARSKRASGSTGRMCGWRCRTMGAFTSPNNSPIDFTGNFSGAFRDIPLAAGVTARNVAVSEAGEDYEPGGATGLGSYDRPGTFGAEQLTITAAGRRADEGLPRRVALRGGFRGARLSARLRRHGSCRGLRRRDLRAVGGVGEPVGVCARRPSRGDRACGWRRASPRAPGFARGGWG